jgi:hypothetical protein
MSRMWTLDRKVVQSAYSHKACHEQKQCMFGWCPSGTRSLLAGTDSGCVRLYKLPLTGDFSEV